MKRLVFGLIFSMLTLFVVGCSDSPQAPPVIEDNEATSNNEDRSLAQEKVLKEIRSEIETDLDVILPRSFPISEDEHLTAVTTGEKDSYSVVFYKNNEPLPLNNQKLINESTSSEEIARLHVEKFSSQTESDQKVSFEDFTNLGGEKVDLGHNIIGYKNAGAGSVFTAWNKGQWSLTTRSVTLEDNMGVELAKEAIEFLENNTLPSPNRYGNVHLDVHHSGNLTIWQDEQVVYTLDNVHDPMDMLKILVEFQ